VLTYAVKHNFGLYSCARAVPDLDRLSDMIAASFEELRKAAAREATRL
jgi:GH43 family beta-xylosidase